MKEGPTRVNVPATHYRSCGKCKYFRNRMVLSGNNPIYRQDCTHPDLSTDLQAPELSYAGNLGESAITPDWCPVAPEGRFKNDINTKSQMP